MGCSTHPKEGTVMKEPPAGIATCPDCPGTVTLVNVFDEQAPEPRHRNAEGELTDCPVK